MAKSKSCTWRGMVARGVYKPSCSTSVMGIPPRQGDPCPGCGRSVIHWRPKTKKRATMADYLKWKSAQQQLSDPTTAPQEKP